MADIRYVPSEALDYGSMPPPKSICINGDYYDIDYDYRTWIKIYSLSRKIDFSDSAEHRQLGNIKLLTEIIELAFAVRPRAPIFEIYSAVVNFLSGYPGFKNPYAQSQREDASPLFSFEHDINFIILAIRNQSGIDLSYRRSEPFHWWEFLLEFQSLESRHHICELISIRGYSGNDPEMLRLKNNAALPPEYTVEEQRDIDELIRIVDGC